MTNSDEDRRILEELIQAVSSKITGNVVVTQYYIGCEKLRKKFPGLVPTNVENTTTHATKEPTETIRNWMFVR